ncbi:pupal cuticle protein G1A-like [Zerene cesonia]|uniref:pupal cuticle protein G1A-like n=1 Tax=Zerene cesonia TaxID=33412 RepID=UPI0018E577BA|nr:pupal cuticle protein G1A-like [Zerene cesonia]
MQQVLLFAAFLACAAAAPGVLLHQAPVVAVHAPVVHALPVASKTTITKSSQLVNHGTPVVHAVHTPVVASVPVVKSVPVVPVVHAPVVHAPVVHAPVVHAPVVTPVVVKTAPVAVSHSSSLVHHAPLKAVPIVAIH